MPSMRLQLNFWSRKNDSFEFHDEEENLVSGYKLQATKRNWLDEERKLLIALFTRLDQVAPGLLKLASVDRPIKLLRVQKFEHEHTDSAAFVGEQKIVFSDGFFLLPDPFRHLVHLVVCVADDSHLAAYSKEWVQIAEPMIESRLAIGWKDRPKKPMPDDWMGDNGCEVLIEGLAQYIALYLCG